MTPFYPQKVIPKYFVWNSTKSISEYYYLGDVFEFCSEISRTLGRTNSVLKFMDPGGGAILYQNSLDHSVPVQTGGRDGLVTLYQVHTIDRATVKVRVEGELGLHPLGTESIDGLRAIDRLKELLELMSLSRGDSLTRITLVF